MTQSSPLQIAYDPSDPVQRGFLANLAKGETGNASNAYSLGTGGYDLSGAQTDSYGFPQWGGHGNSHAAGKYQFQPATWSDIASQFGLVFSHPEDQDAGAWYYAEQVYSRNTGRSLEDALQSGDYQSVQRALASVWPSVTGNQANPQGLANTVGSTIEAAQNGTLPSAGASQGQDVQGGQPQGLLASAEDFFVRFGLLIIGGIIIIVVLWQLLANQGIVPSPGDTAKLAVAAL